jgi:lysophospholipase L1-like esterase
MRSGNVRALLAALLLLVAVLPASAAQLYNSDNSTTGFDATTAGSTPTGWANVGAATWQASTTSPLTGHTHTLSNPHLGNGEVALYTGGGTTADTETVYAQTISNNTSSAGAVLRSDASFANGYLAFVDVNAGQAQIYKKVSGTLSLIASGSLGFTISTSDIILIRAQALGTTIQMRAWKRTSAEPTTWQATVTDSSISAAGYTGLYYGGTTADAVSDLAIDTISSSQGFFNLSPVQTSSSPITISGTYYGTAPSGIDYSVDGGSYSAASSPTISGGTFSFTITNPSTGYHAISVRNASATTITDSGIYKVGTALTTIAPNNAALIYSPYNWLVNSTNAVTINPGAYFKTLFTGTSITLNFDASLMATPVSQIWWRIDFSTWTQANVASTVALTIRTATLSNADIPYHMLEVVVKSTTQSANRWNTAATSGTVKLTGITLDSGATVHAPSVQAKNILIYGDSITEGARTVGESNANDTDNSDALQGWAYLLGQKLGAEVGVVGFGGSGYQSTGSGSVPDLRTSYNLLFSGQSRSFTTQPDLVIVNDGTNDSATGLTAAATTAFNNILGVTTGKVVVLDPLPASVSSTVRTNIQTAITNIGSSRLVWAAATGIFNTAYGADTINLHPSGPNDQGIIAPQLSTLLAPYLYPSTGSKSPTHY